MHLFLLIHLFDISLSLTYADDFKPDRKTGKRSSITSDSSTRESTVTIEDKIDAAYDWNYNYDWGDDDEDADKKKVSFVPFSIDLFLVALIFSFCYMEKESLFLPLFPFLFLTLLFFKIYNKLVG